MIILALSVLAVPLGTIAAFLIIRSITRPLNEAVRLAQRVAAGDLTSKVVVKSKYETGMLPFRRRRTPRDRRR